MNNISICMLYSMLFLLIVLLHVLHLSLIFHLQIRNDTYAVQCNPIQHYWVFTHGHQTDSNFVVSNKIVLMAELNYTELFIHKREGLRNKMLSLFNCHSTYNNTLTPKLLVKFYSIQIPATMPLLFP